MRLQKEPSPDLKHALGLVARLIEALAQFLGQRDKLHREVLFFLEASVFFPVGFRGVLTGFFNHRGHFKAHRNGARGTLCVLQIEGEHHTGLEKAVSPTQVRLEGGTQGVAMPLGLGHMLAIAPDPGVVGADDNWFQVVFLDGLFQNRVEQGARLPGGAGENFVVGRPILLGIALETNGAGERTPAHAAQDAKGQGDGSLEAAVLGENKTPAGGLVE